MTIGRNITLATIRITATLLNLVTNVTSQAYKKTNGDIGNKISHKGT
jgi:hypothetical protein